MWMEARGARHFVRVPTSLMELFPTKTNIHGMWQV
jgi:hypothetical protein